MLYTNERIARFLKAYHKMPVPHVQIEWAFDENLHICIAASFGERLWAAKAVFGERTDKAAKISKISIDNFECQTKGLLGAMRRTLLKAGVINEYL